MDKPNNNEARKPSLLLQPIAPAASGTEKRAFSARLGGEQKPKTFQRVANTTGGVADQPAGN